ncbi:protein of unknown function [Shewanella benthica]|uniref:Uncharacterized protein n=1 Tax=Shewanella benthica TaxID=43661 RepID=A0A330LVW5_9GAMM|nr:protein of unknown function [Shewanella benthica]
MATCHKLANERHGLSNWLLYTDVFSRTGLLSMDAVGLSLIKRRTRDTYKYKNQTRKSPNIAIRAYRNVCGRVWRQAQAFERVALAKLGRSWGGLSLL